MTDAVALDGFAVRLLAGLALFLLVAAIVLWARFEGPTGQTRWQRHMAILGRVLLRVSFALLPFLALALFVIVTLILPQADMLEGGRSVTIGGLITGTVIAVGWLATSTASEFREELVRDRTRRDTLIALRSEIFAFIETLDTYPISARAVTAQDQIRLGGPDGEGGPEPYFPYPVQESAPVIFDAVSHDIRLLEDETVAAIVRFYAAYTDLRSVIDGARAKEVQEFSIDRRVRMHEVLTSRRIVALGWGLGAFEAINKELGEDPDKPIKRKYTEDGELMNPDVPEGWKGA